MNKKFTVAEIRYLNNHFGNGYFFSRSTMRFFKDTMKDFATYLNKDGNTIVFHKKRGSTWIFNKEDYSLKPYKEEVKQV